MKDYIGGLIGTLIICVIFFPWLIGIVDLAAWAVIGEQVTSIPWKSMRGAVLVLWPFAWACLIMLCFMS